MQKKQKIAFLIVIVSCALLVTSSASANYNWKDFFSFGEKKAITKAADKAILNNLKTDEDWKGAISGRNIKDGSISGTKIDPNFGTQNIFGGNFIMNSLGGAQKYISDSSGIVTIGKSGYDALKLNGNATVDGGLTINRGIFAKWHLLLDSVSAGQQVHITDSSNVVAIGDGVNDTIKLQGDIVDTIKINGGYADGMDTGGVTIGNGGGIQARGNLVVDGNATFFGGIDVHQGRADFSTGTMVIPRGEGAPDADPADTSGACEGVDDIGKMYIDVNSGGNMYICSNKQASIGWDTVNLAD